MDWCRCRCQCQCWCRYRYRFEYGYKYEDRYEDRYGHRYRYGYRYRYECGMDIIIGIMLFAMATFIVTSIYTYISDVRLVTAAAGMRTPISSVRLASKYCCKEERLVAVMSISARGWILFVLLLVLVHWVNLVLILVLVLILLLIVSDSTPDISVSCLLSDWLVTGKGNGNGNGKWDNGREWWCFAGRKVLSARTEKSPASGYVWVYFSPSN